MISFSVHAGEGSVSLSSDKGEPLSDKKLSSDVSKKRGGGGEGSEKGGEGEGKGGRRGEGEGREMGEGRR